MGTYFQVEITSEQWIELHNNYSQERRVNIERRHVPFMCLGLAGTHRDETVSHWN